MKTKHSRSENLHLRVDPDFKQRIEAAAAALDIPPSAYARMALREYIDRNFPDQLREPPAGYTAPKPGQQPPPSTTARCAAHAQRTAYYVISRPD